jgi:hypothetical protein
MHVVDMCTSLRGVACQSQHGAGQLLQMPDYMPHAEEYDQFDLQVQCHSG